MTSQQTSSTNVLKL